MGYAIFSLVLSIPEVVSPYYQTWETVRAGLAWRCRDHRHNISTLCLAAGEREPVEREETAGAALDNTGTADW